MTQSYDGTSGNDYFAARMTPNQYGYYRWEPWFIHDYEGDDTLIGGQKNDSLYGGADNDRLEGKDGRDLLDGGSGYDTMFSGAASDIYVVDQWSDPEVSPYLRVHV